MMKRFYFGGDEDGEDEDSESFEMPSASELIAMTQAENPFKLLVDFSVRVCESSWLWRFLPLDRKISMVSKAFREFALMQEEYEENGEI